MRGRLEGMRWRGDVRRRVAPQDTLVGSETRLNPRRRSPPEPGTGQPELSDARGVPWALGCQLWTLMPSPAPAPYPRVAPSVSRRGRRPTAVTRPQAGNQRPRDKWGHAAPWPCHQ